MSENRMPEATAEFLHDLRLPLQLISSCAQLIELETEDTPSLQSYTRMLLESVAEVQRLLHCLRNTAFQIWRHHKPVHNNINIVAQILIEFRPFFKCINNAVDACTRKTFGQILLANMRE